MADQTKTARRTLPAASIRSVAKLLAATLVVLFVLGVVSILPGIDHFMPGTPITLFAIASVLLSLAIAGMLITLAPDLAALVPAVLDASAEIVENVASVVYWGIVLLAIVIVHRGVYPAAASILNEWIWVFDVVFLALTVPPLLIVVLRLSLSVTPASDAIADRFATDTESN